MGLVDELGVKLPAYLSAEEKKELFEGLKGFPENLDKIYGGSRDASEYLLQGDGVLLLPVANLPEARVEQVPAIILTNTCDIDPDNKRITPARLTYCPYASMEAYARLLADSGITPEKVEQHFREIRRQEITTKLFLPAGSGLSEDSVVFLDMVNSCDSSVVSVDKVPELRVFTLSLYGFYLFLIKLSIHFTRFREAVER